jgi:hypothetical protein
MNCQKHLDEVQTRSPNFVDTGTSAMRDSAIEEYKQAMDELESEKLVAGEPFKGIVGNLTTFIWFHVWGNIQKPIQIGGEKPFILSDFEFSARLADKIDETIKEIDDISQ